MKKNFLLTLTILFFSTALHTAERHNVFIKKISKKDQKYGTISWNKKEAENYYNKAQKLGELIYTYLKVLKNKNVDIVSHLKEDINTAYDQIVANGAIALKIKKCTPYMMPNVRQYYIDLCTPLGKLEVASISVTQNKTDKNTFLTNREKTKQHISNIHTLLEYKVAKIFGERAYQIIKTKTDNPLNFSGKTLERELFCLQTTEKIWNRVKPATRKPCGIDYLFAKKTNARLTK